MKVTVDRVKCSGIGLCELAAPTVFEIGDDSQTHVISDVDEANLSAVEEAVSNCPTSALTLER